MRLAGSLGILGLNRRSLYDDDFNVDATTAPWLSGMFLPGVKVGHGRNVKTEVAVLRIGLAQIAVVPAELLPELSIGLPEDFSSNTARYFPKEAAAHPTGDKYCLAYPPLKQQMDAEFKLVFCLANDDLGYVIPRADFNPPHDIKIPPLAWWWICTDSDNEPHYEESMSISRRIEPALLGALTRLLSPELFEQKAQAQASDQSAPPAAGQPAGGSAAEEERR